MDGWLICRYEVKSAWTFVMKHWQSNKKPNSRGCHPWHVNHIQSQQWSFCTVAHHSDFPLLVGGAKPLRDECIIGQWGLTHQISTADSNNAIIWMLFSLILVTQYWAPHDHDYTWCAEKPKPTKTKMHDPWLVYPLKPEYESCCWPLPFTVSFLFLQQ